MERTQENTVKVQYFMENYNKFLPFPVKDRLFQHNNIKKVPNYTQFIEFLLLVLYMFYSYEVIQSSTRKFLKNVPTIHLFKVFGLSTKSFH